MSPIDPLGSQMCRSVMIKGIEALPTESPPAARHYGVESVMLDSLNGLLPAADWRSLSHYMIGRSSRHGSRRAAAHCDAPANRALEDMLDTILAPLGRDHGVRPC